MVEAILCISSCASAIVAYYIEDMMLSLYSRNIATVLRSTILFIEASLCGEIFMVLPTTLRESVSFAFVLLFKLGGECFRETRTVYGLTENLIGVSLGT